MLYPKIYLKCILSLTQVICLLLLFSPRACFDVHNKPQNSDKPLIANYSTKPIDLDSIRQNLRKHVEATFGKNSHGNNRPTTATDTSATQLNRERAIDARLNAARANQAWNAKWNTLPKEKQLKIARIMEDILAHPGTYGITDADWVNTPQEERSTIIGAIVRSMGEDEDEEDELACKICYEVKEDRRKLLCGHIFCIDCIKQWSKACKNRVLGNPTCPCCRKPYTP